MLCREQVMLIRLSLCIVHSVEYLLYDTSNLKASSIPYQSHHLNEKVHKIMKEINRCLTMDYIKHL